MEKETLNIVIIGHVDHGKSTLVGRLLIDTNSLPEDKLAEIKKISKELGKETEIAHITDQLKEERERNLTLDTAQIFFKSRRRDYCIIDTPGHLEFIKNMITGASRARAAVLIVDVNEGVMEQTQRHAYLVSLLGLKNLIVLFNKMDIIDYGEQRFQDVKRALLRFLDNLKIKPSCCIPVSAKFGCNVSKKSSHTRWYKGPPLLKALDEIGLEASAKKRPFRFPVQDVYEINGERILVGRVASGSVKQGRKIIILPSKIKSRIKTVRIHNEPRKLAGEGESIGLILTDSPNVTRGDIISDDDFPPVLSTRIKGNLFWMAEEPLRVGKAATLRLATQEAEVVVEAIERKIDSSTLDVIEEESDRLSSNEAATVTFRSEKEIALEIFSFIEELGRFVIERDYNIQGVGIIKEEQAGRVQGEGV